MPQYPWIAEYEKWNVDPNFVVPDPKVTLAAVINDKLKIFANKKEGLTLFFI